MELLGGAAQDLKGLKTSLLATRQNLTVDSLVAISTAWEDLPWENFWWEKPCIKTHHSTCSLFVYFEPIVRNYNIGKIKWSLSILSNIDFCGNT